MGGFSFLFSLQSFVHINMNFSILCIARRYCILEDQLNRIRGGADDTADSVVLCHRQAAIAFAPIWD